MSNHIAEEKNEDREYPVPKEWRSKIAEIVSVVGNSSRADAGSISSLDRISSDVERSIAANLTDYGCVIDPVSSSTWTTSICRWMGGYWQVLVDLFSEGEHVDLVLFLRVTETGDEYKFCVESIHVP